jgi:hypothetical protein
VLGVVGERGCVRRRAPVRESGGGLLDDVTGPGIQVLALDRLAQRVAELVAKHAAKPCSKRGASAVEQNGAATAVPAGSSTKVSTRHLISSLARALETREV